ncbi:hypothetical protein CERZMDRAFT_106194 [Cercospora zeae-maydis SCOH1-5]|uniref:Uncharacterized protein n=1 Tax=Cercospora zeae-maydis SCOH1-5 TaxID=717836 RepID=A0A6A6FGF6_9PEZI|nr:hypothetical protein CERZMDRAFT_106194 [Cercospora zeae-maydis SCOH1-5]
MATVSPAKHHRLERHLQRQRGAGVRSLATSFGFSFGLPSAAPVPPALESTHDDERPTKRRKSNGVLAAPKPEQKEDDAKAQEKAAADVKPQQPLAVHDEEIEGIVPDETEDNSTTQTRVAPKEPSRSRKAVKGIQAADDVAATGAKLPAKKRGRPKKALGTEYVEKNVALGVATDRTMAMTAAQVAMGLSTTASADAEAKATSPHATKPATKRRGRPRKNAASDAAPSSMSVPIEEPELQLPARPKRHAATTAMIKVSEGFLEEESDVTKKRRDEVLVSCTGLKTHLSVHGPITDRSQATTRAREGAPQIIDDQCGPEQQCREALPQTVRRRAKRGPAADIGENAERSSDAAAVDRKPTKSASVARVEHSGPVEETAHAIKLTSTTDVKPRRRAAAMAQSKVSEGFLEESGDISKKRRNPESSSGVAKPQAKSSGRSKTSHKLDVQTASAGELLGLPVATECEDEKRETPIARPDREISHERRPLAETEVNLPSISPAKNTPEGIEKQPKQTVQKLVIPRKTALKASAEGSTRTAATKKFKASKIFVDDDAAHIVKAPQNNAFPHNSVLSLGPAPSITGSKTPSVETGSLGDACTGAHSKKQGASKKGHKPNARDTSNLPSKTLRTAHHGNEINEDVDWLFEVSKPSAPRRRVAKQPPVPRQERKGIADASEIDLDDLLSNIATFVPGTNASQSPPIQARAIKKRK